MKKSPRILGKQHSRANIYNTPDDEERIIMISIYINTYKLFKKFNASSNVSTGTIIISVPIASPFSFAST